MTGSQFKFYKIVFLFMHKMSFLLVLVSIFNCNVGLYATLTNSESSEVIFTLDDLDAYDACRKPLSLSAASQKRYGSFDSVASSADTISWNRRLGEGSHAERIRQKIQEYPNRYTDEIVQFRENLPASPTTLPPVAHQYEESESCLKTLSRGMTCLFGWCCK